MTRGLYYSFATGCGAEFQPDKAFDTTGNSTASEIDSLPLYDHEFVHQHWIHLHISAHVSRISIRTDRGGQVLLLFDAYISDLDPEFPNAPNRSISTTQFSARQSSGRKSSGLAAAKTNHHD